MLTAGSLEYLRHAFEEQSVERLVVGLSGGMDSVALLHVLVNALADPALLGPPDAGRSIIALHVNHGLQPAAQDFEDCCRTVCEKLQVPLLVRHVLVRHVEVAGHSAGNKKGGNKKDGNKKGGNKKGGIEAAARHARYAAFSEEVGQHDLLLLAHHADDQVETALFNLLRGSRQPGLMGMPRERKLQWLDAAPDMPDMKEGMGRLYRPLLDITRADIQAYVDFHQLDFVEDPSNQDLQHDRNWIRHQLIPMLEQRWPDVRETLLASLHRDEQLRRQQQERQMQLLAQMQGDSLERLFKNSPERSFNNSLERSLENSPERSFGNSLEPSLENSLERIFSNSLERSLENSLDLNKLRELAAQELSSKSFSPKRSDITSLIDTWLMSLGLPLPSAGVMSELLANFLTDRAQTSGVIRYENLEFRCHEGRLYVLRHLPELTLPPGPPDDWQAFAPLLEGHFEAGAKREAPTPWGSISVASSQNKDKDKDKGKDNGEGQGKNRGLKQQPGYVFAARSGGEKMKRGRTRTLKNLYQETKMPAWLRDAVPLILHQGKVVALPAVPAWGVPMLIADGYTATENTPGLEVNLHFRDMLRSAEDYLI